MITNTNFCPPEVQSGKRPKRARTGGMSEGGKFYAEKKRTRDRK